MKSFFLDVSSVNGGFNEKKQKDLKGNFYARNPGNNRLQACKKPYLSTMYKNMYNALSKKTSKTLINQRFGGFFTSYKQCYVNLE